jgi:hypothetical protein
MSSRSRIGSLAVLLLIAATASADLAVRLENENVIVSGATPGRDVLLYGISHRALSYGGAIDHQEDLRAADGSGAASWPVSGGLSSRSLWLAVDVQTGSIAATTPDGFPLRRLEAPLEVVRQKDLIEALELPFFYSEVLFVRPGTGAWAQSASRGGSKDLRGKAHSLTVDPRAFRNVHGTQAGPVKVQRDDVVIVIDPYALSFFSFRWKQ